MAGARPSGVGRWMRSKNTPTNFSKTYFGGSAAECRRQAAAYASDVLPMGYAEIGEAWELGDPNQLTIHYSRVRRPAPAARRRSSPPFTFVALGLVVLVIVAAAAIVTVTQPLFASAHPSPDQPKPAATLHVESPAPTMNPKRTAKPRPTH